MGIIFKFPAYAVYIVSGVWGLFVSMRIIYENFGGIIAFVSFFLAPFAIALAPWYEGIVNGGWFPVFLVYGGSIFATVLYVIGSFVDKD